ncbi:MAG: hypothetical protein IJ571_03080 [Ruminococcus sp.]|nr:hypothetical protein [Ruminococcus sp.]
MISRKQRIIALVFALLLGVIILGSSLFVALESDHECIGEGCEICLAVEQCEKVLSAVSLAVGAFFAAAFLSVAAAAVIIIDMTAHRSATPISLKVKLLD